jgi:hypothetical protein
MPSKNTLTEKAINSNLTVLKKLLEFAGSNSRASFCKAAADFQKNLVRKRVPACTRMAYESALRNRIVPYFRHVTVGQINSHMIRNFTKSMGGATRKGV